MANSPTNATDPSGLAKAKALGWVVQRTGTHLIRGATIFTERQAAKLFLKGSDIMVRGGRSVAKSVALKAIPEKRLLRHTAHFPGGFSHYQHSKIANRHIFYGMLGATVLAALEQDSNACDAAISLDALYSNEFPGPSAANMLTFSWWAPGTYLEYIDWVNPGELVAMGGDLGRSIDRELSKEFLGIVVTLKTDSSPQVSYTLDANGVLVSVAQWSDGELGEAIPAEEFLKTIDATDKSQAMQEIIELARPLLERQ